VLVRNIERFVALRERNPLLRVHTSYVVLRQNLAEIPEFMLLNLQWGAEYIHFHPAIRGAFPQDWLVDPFDLEFVRTMAAAEMARAMASRSIDGARARASSRTAGSSRQRAARPSSAERGAISRPYFAR
jgi:hypothetical protein